MQPLNVDSLPGFEDWLQTKRPLGLSATPTQLAVGDASGKSWRLTLATTVVLAETLNLLAASGRKVWSEDGARAAVRLSRLTSRDVETLDWLLCATTARNVIQPGFWLELKDRGAAANAVATARRMVELSTGTAPETITAVFASCKQDQLWRPRQAMGWRVDAELLRNELQAAEAARSAALAELGFDATDTNSEQGKAKIHDWLAEANIFVVDFRGRPTLDRESYDDTIIPGNDAARDRWATFRRVRSVASRIGKLKEIRRALKGDRVFSTVRVRYARTGRGSIIRPALQNINRDLRPLLLAEPGETLVALDLSQAEPRTAAALSGDEHLIAALAAGDVYAAMAERLWGGAALDAAGTVLPAMRDRAKTLFIAILYGKRAPRTARELGVSEAEAQELIDSLWASYPTLAAYGRRIIAEMAAGNAELTSGGRPIPPPRRGNYAIVNNRVQAEAADIFYGGVERVAAAIGTKALFLPIHDELVLSVPPGQVQFVKEVLEREMNSVFRRIPIGGTAVELGLAWRKAG